MENQKILIVEDSGMVAAEIEHMLKLSGYQVPSIVTSGEEAVRQAELLRPNLVLMDIRLSGEMDGITAAGIVRDCLQIPVVYLTAYADDDTIARAQITEPYGYVLKPFREIELRTAVKLALFKHCSEQTKDERKAKRVVLAKELDNTAAQFYDSSQSSAADKGANRRAEEKYKILRRIDPFSHLDDSVLKSLESMVSIEYYDAEVIVSCEGDENVFGFVVVSGRAAFFKTSSSGRELVVDSLNPGDPFGLILSLDEVPYSASLKTQVPSVMLRVPRSLMCYIFDQYPRLFEEFVENVFKRIRSGYDLSRSLAHDRTEIRVASALLTLCSKSYSIDKTEVAGICKLEITRRELADLIGSTPETVSRVISGMAQNKVVDISSSGVIAIIDMAELQHLAECERTGGW